MTQNTTTGKMFEAMMETALVKSGYTIERQIRIGLRPGGGKHIVDIRTTNRNNEKVLISIKWQDVSGTAEQKIPYDVISLIHSLDIGESKKGYIVLGGKGFNASYKKWLLDGGLNIFIREDLIHLIDIVDGETFLAKIFRKCI